MSNVPKLRFKGFEGEWMKKDLSDLLKVNSGRDYKHLGKGDVPVYGTGGYMLSVDEYLSDVDAIGIGRKGSIDKPQYLEAPFWTVDTLFYCTSKDNVDLYFLNILFQVIRWKKYDESTGVPSLSKKTIEKIVQYAPCIDEQQKIGEFFKGIDRKIQNQQEKIELLKEQKKGYMQKIFNRELRFKDENGKAYPEWKEYIFNDLFEPRNIKQVPDEEAPLMAFTSTDGIQDKGERYNREFLVKNKNKKYKKTFYNDIIYSSNNLDVGAIGRNKFGTVVISDVYEIFSVKEKITPEFAEALITQKKVLHKILKYRQGALYGQYRIHATDFLKVTTSIPSFKEQVKISSFIKKIDNKINLEEKLLFQLNLKQKSLLQQMFV